MVKLDRRTRGYASRVGLGLSLVATCAASCAVEDKEYRFEDAEGGVSGVPGGAGGGASTTSGGAFSGMNTGGSASGGRSGTPDPSGSGGARAEGGGRPNGESGSGGSVNASGGQPGATSGGASPLQTGGATARGGMTSTAGTSGNAGGAGTAVNECAGTENPCLNGSQCQDSEVGFTCTCLSRYTGSRCEHLKFRGMGHVTGGTASNARKISDDGMVAAGSATTMAGGTVPVRVNLSTGGPLQSLGLPANTTGCLVTATNADGTWLGGSCLGLQFGGGFMWTPNDGPSLATTSTYKSLNFSDATPDGRIRTGTITVQEGDDPQPFRWTVSDGFVPLEMPGAGTHYGSALGAKGDVIVGNFVGTVDGATAGRGFRWTTSSAASYLPVPAEFKSTYVVNGLSEDGSVIVGYGVGEDRAPHALRWSGAALELEDVGGGALMDCSGDGQVLLGINAAREIVIWESGVARTLLSILGDTPDLSGWTLVEPAAISNDGKVVVGNGTHDGVSEGWIAHL